MQILNDPFLSSALNKSAYLLNMTDYMPSDSIRIALSDQIISESAFVHAKVPVIETKRVWALEEVGFKLIDTNIKLCKPVEIKSNNFGPSIRPALEKDKEKVKALAKKNFNISRFHMDPNIHNDIADEIKGAWAENYFSGKRGDAMIVAEDNGNIAGFLLLLMKGSMLIVDLIVVDSTYRRKGIARAMIEYAQLQYPDFETMVTGTQAANTASLSFYENNGFRICEAFYVLHLHYSQQDIIRS